MEQIYLPDLLENANLLIKDSLQIPSYFKFWENKEFIKSILNKNLQDKLNQKLKVEILVQGDEHIHLKALRTKIGQNILITNGIGATAKSEVMEFTKTYHRVKILDIDFLPNETKQEIILVIGVLDNKDRLEFVVEKATELGIHKIFIVNTKYSEKVKVNLERLNAKAIAALKQAKRSILPIIYFNDFEDIISKKQLDNIKDTNELVHILADIEGKTEDFKESIIETKKIVIFVGSEGGFSENEINQIEYHKNTLKIKLSNNRLRAETAAISILSNTLAKLID